MCPAAECAPYKTEGGLCPVGCVETLRGRAKLRGWRLHGGVVRINVRDRFEQAFAT